uniref:Nuclear receptor n=1 Tax=Syphacia muris TaxID=451379 RepID=A0A0N5AJV3_9BILA
MTEKLPPGTLCVVCHDLATGNHYSIPSCNGCKTFFRRAVVKNRTFACMGNGNCPISKGGRCACRHCRFKKCLEVGMDRNSIQNDRDRIGYTKRTRKADKASATEKKRKISSTDPLQDRLTTLENNFTLLLSRGKIEPYGSLDHALASPSLFNRPIEMSDPIAVPKPDSSDKPHLPFWRSRIIALYIDWAKTFPAFKNLPYSDKVALITNHASSYMVMCEAFRTPEHTENKILNTGGFVDCVSKNGASTVADGGLKTQHFTNDVNQEYCQKNAWSLDPSSNEYVDYPVSSSSVAKSNAYEQTELKSDANCCSSLNEKQANMHEFLKPGLFDEGENASMLDRPSLKILISVVCINFVFCRLTGLTPVLTAMIDYIMKPFRRLNISTTEFAVLQAIMFFDPDTKGLDSASQRNVIAEQKKLLAALYRYICAHYNPIEADDRYAAILLCIPTIRKVAAKKNESLQIIDLLKIFELNSLLKETALGIRPPDVLFITGCL